MTDPTEMTNAQLRTEALEALAVSKDRTVLTPARSAAREKWELLTAEIGAREGSEFQKRQNRLLRGF